MNTVTLKRKLQRHFTGFIPAMAVLLFIASATWLFTQAFDYSFQRFSPTTFWYEYDEVAIELVSEYPVAGEYIVFHSNSRYKLPIDMRWDDTLYCRYNDGSHQLKIGTQTWSEFVAPKITPDDERWTWNKRVLPTGYAECRLESNVIGTTSLGFEKTFTYIGPWFDVQPTPRNGI